MTNLTGRVALVTGAARGQGRSHAVALAQAGADVVGLDACKDVDSVPYPLAKPDDLDETGKLVQAEGRQFLGRECDVRSSQSLDEAIQVGLERFGRIDILVANAGIWGLGVLWELTDAQWQDMIDVNLTGVWRTLKAVLPTMIEAHRGSVILTASVNGLEGGPGYAHYVAAKHGVVGLMRNAALELGPFGVRCNAVCPGFIDTAMNDWQGAYDMMAGAPGGTPEDRRVGAYNWSALAGQGMLPTAAISDAVVWLASDAAARITGVTLPVDSGHMVLPGSNGNPVLEVPAP
jgi:SDR family mycofactocin-dependent oxidoreductase